VNVSTALFPPDVVKFTHATFEIDRSNNIC